MSKRGFKKIQRDIFIKQYKENYNKSLNYYENIELPCRKTMYSAGYDISSYKDIVLKANEFKIIPTGLKAFMQNDEWLAIYIRSSLGFKHNIRLMNQVGVIDSDYYENPENDGHILIALQNHSDKTKLIKQGEAFAQGIFQKYLISDEANSEKVRTGGLGSTDKKI